MVVLSNENHQENLDSQSIFMNELSALNQNHQDIHSSINGNGSGSGNDQDHDERSLPASSINLRLSRYSTSTTWLFISGCSLLALIMIVFNNYDYDNSNLTQRQERSTPISMFEHDARYFDRQGLVSPAANADAAAYPQSKNGKIIQDENEIALLPVLGIESSGHHHHQHHGGAEEYDNDSVAALFKETKCMKDKDYSSNTVKKVFEIPFIGLFKDTKGEKKFEASSITKVGDVFYSVCDNSWSLSKFDASLTPFSAKNMLIGDPNREEDDSGYEAILHYNKTFFVIRESVEHVNVNKSVNENENVNMALEIIEGKSKTGSKKKHHGHHKKQGNHSEAVYSSYHAIVEELIIDDDESDYKIVQQCKCEFEFEGDSKGFEGAFGMPGLDGDFYIVGLCEGNHCSESQKFDAGNGEMVMMKKSVSESNCIWETVKKISIPKSAYFRDYSDIEVSPSGRVAITSQEDSRIFVGQLLGISNGVLDPDAIAFDEEKFKLYDFPKSDGCMTVYCNIEGITFINDEMIMAVSDKMKKRGKQPYWCLEKDQSIHAFVLP